jgi:hypothetical protein
MDALIESITRLYRQISERLLQARVDSARRHGGSAPKIDIAESLIARVRANATQNRSDRPERTLSTESTSPVAPGHEGGEAISSLQGAPTPYHERPLLPNELAMQFSKEPRAGALLPAVGEQLKRRTFEYINRALELGKEGNAECAETYAKLAECALKTAADYLSEDEYLLFTQEVLSRVAPSDGTSA